MEIPRILENMTTDDLMYVLFLAVVSWLVVALWNDTGGGGKRDRMPVRA
jgi:hypothetical protein